MSEPRYEGLVTRAIAFAVDAAVINVVAIAVAGIVALGVSILSVPDEVDTVLVALGGVLFVAWSAGYFIVFWSTTGQTPGSRLMRISVVLADDGAVLRPRAAALRLVYLTLAAIPLLAGFLPILVDDRRRGLHDMLAATVVVEAPSFTLADVSTNLATGDSDPKPRRVRGAPPPRSASATRST
jgi:uncharacterized RDD family membrane protein YckC